MDTVHTSWASLHELQEQSYGLRGVGELVVGARKCLGEEHGLGEIIPCGCIIVLDVEGDSFVGSTELKCRPKGFICI